MDKYEECRLICWIQILNWFEFICLLFIGRFCVGDRFYLCENKILCEYDYEERLVFANMAYNPSSLAHIRRQVSSLQVRIIFLSSFFLSKILKKSPMDAQQAFGYRYLAMLYIVYSSTVRWTSVAVFATICSMARYRRANAWHTHFKLLKIAHFSFYQIYVKCFCRYKVCAETLGHWSHPDGSSLVIRSDLFFYSLYLSLPLSRCVHGKNFDGCTNKWCWFDFRALLGQKWENKIDELTNANEMIAIYDSESVFLAIKRSENVTVNSTRLNTVQSSWGVHFAIFNE